MKRGFLMAATLLMMAVAAYAQGDVTTFLGIPVDGSKDEMIGKLAKKGFTYDRENDRMSGEFNGKDAFLYIATNNDKVYRIMVLDKNGQSEGNIRINFNTLCDQFERNKKYLSLDEGLRILEDEDINYEMSVHDKRYQASYIQNVVDTAAISSAIMEYALSKYTQEEIDNPTEEMSKDVMAYSVELLMKKSVWFMIIKDSLDDYRILLFYDNKYNQADGEDL